MPIPTNITLAILAGGEGSRMGRPKGTLQIGGKPILQFLLERFAWPGPTLLVTSPGRENPAAWELFSRQAVDPVAGLGPLRGMLTALENSHSECNIIVTVDMPGLGTEHLAWIAGRGTETNCMGLMLRTDRIAPFPFFLKRKAKEIIAVRLAEGRRSVHSLSEIPGFLTIPAPTQWPAFVWKNLNTPDDLATYWPS